MCAAVALLLPRPPGAVAASSAATTSNWPSRRRPERSSRWINLGNVIVSPDGTKVAFVAATPKATTLWVRSLAVDDGRSISGTEGAYHFWSLDGKRLGFRRTRLRCRGHWRRTAGSHRGRAAGRGGSWTEDGSILFTPTGGTTVLKVAATGGAVTPLTKLDTTRGENAHYWPVVLPGGSFLYFARSTRVENSGIYLARIDGRGSAPGSSRGVARERSPGWPAIDRRAVLRCGSAMGICWSSR